MLDALARRSTVTRMTDATAAAAPTPDAIAAQRAMKRIVTAAWLAAIAGIAAQLAVIGVRLWAGGTINQAGFLAEMAQGVTWSFLVCAAIAVGTLAAKSRGLFAGIIGLLAGPLAWASAKGVQKGVQAAAGVPEDQFTPLFWMVCGVKGIEYAVLGAALTTIVGRDDAKLPSYLTLGLLLGLAGAGAIVALNLGNAAMAGTEMPAPRIASLAANEVFFATACCLVIYAAQMFTRHASVLKAA